METLTAWLGSLNINVASDRKQPDGARRLQLELSDGTPLEVVLSRSLLLGSRADAKSYLEALLDGGARPRRVKGYQP